MPSDDWHALKKLVGAGSHQGPTGDRLDPEWHASLLEELPEHLRDHEITTLMREYWKTGDGDLSQRAAVLLTGSEDHAWLAIWKG